MSSFKLYFFTIIIVVAQSFTIYSQNLEYDWISCFGGSGQEYSNDIIYSPSGSIYQLTTAHSDTLGVNINGYVDTFITTFEGHTLITKLNQFGETQWIKQYQGTYARGINVSDDGYLYVVGEFAGMLVDFDPGPDTTLLESTVLDGFIMKLDTSGNFIWAKKIGGTYFDGIEDIKSDADSNLIVIGYFSETADIDPGPAIYHVTSHGYIDIFLLKLTRDGELIWVRTFGGIGQDVANALAIDSNNDIIMCGSFHDNVALDSCLVSSNGLSDWFLLKFSSNGELKWIKNSGGTGYDGADDLVLDNNNNIYVTGFFSDSLVIDAFKKQIWQSKGGLDAYIIKYSEDGDILWANTYGSAEDDRGSVIDLNMDVVWLGGYYSDSIDFDSGIDEEIFTSNGQRDAFMLAIDKNNNFIEAVSFGGEADEEFNGLLCTDLGTIYSSGNFEENIYFGSDTTTLTFQSNGYRDCFLHKMQFNNLTIQVVPNSNFQVYPNPTSSNFYLTNSLNHNIKLIELFDIKGSCLYSLSSENFNGMIDVSDFPKGIFIIRITTDFFIETQKIVIQ